MPAPTHENRPSELMLEHLTRQGVTGLLELVLVDGGVTAAAARTLGRHRDVEMRRVGWDDKAAGVPDHPGRLARRGRPRPPRALPPLAKSFEQMPDVWRGRRTGVERSRT